MLRRTDSDSQTIKGPRFSQSEEGIELSMQFLHLSLVFITIVTIAADVLENLSLFPDLDPSLIAFNDMDLFHDADPLYYNDGVDLFESIDGVDLFDYSEVHLLGYHDNTELQTVPENLGLDSNLFTINDCSSALGFGLVSRIRGRADLCRDPPTAEPQPEMPPLDPSLTSIRDSLQNEEICSKLVFAHRNIPLCCSDDPLHRGYDDRSNSYSLKDCYLCMSQCSVQNP
jgi:hypothetical protein